MDPLQSRARGGAVQVRPGASPDGRSRGDLVALDGELREQSFGVRGTGPVRGLVARVREISRGPFKWTEVAEHPSGLFGLLVLDGFVAVGLDAGRAQVSWLIGSDDLVRPWDMHRISLTEESDWRALTHTRVAVLDANLIRRAGGTPAIACAMVAKAAQTSHWLLAKSLVVSAPIIEERLLLLFALLAERWGRVTPSGVSLELPLTQEGLARMCGARRPSVSTALRSLGEAGLVECPRRGHWLLHGGSPALGTTSWTTNGCWRRYANAIGFDDCAGETGEATPCDCAA
jgi:CRP/FNR family cyclic AMP-dependent transcriptional regulator